MLCGRNNNIVDLLLFSHSVVSDSLWPYQLQHPRLPCPSPSPGNCSNSCPLSRWFHPTISSSVTPSPPPKKLIHSKMVHLSIPGAAGVSWTLKKLIPGSLSIHRTAGNCLTMAWLVIGNRTISLFKEPSRFWRREQSEQVYHSSLLLVQGQTTI